MTDTYTAPTIATAALPPVEVWTEIRCPSCVPLGWEASRLLFKVYGTLAPTGATIQVRCHRCKSLIGWEIGTPRLVAIEKGPQNHRKQHTAFE